MASIYKRTSKSYCIIYYYKNEEGLRKQKWESGYTYRQAKKRKTEIENDLLDHSFILPNQITVRDLIEKVVRVYGCGNWQPKTYETNLTLINNHINPHIGDKMIQTITPMDIESLFVKLLRKNRVRDKSKTLSSATRHNIYIILKQSFTLAVRWKLIKESPIIMRAPQINRKEALFWDAPTMRKALEHLDDEQLHLGVHLAFACTLRIGEVLGLTWDCVDFDNSKIHINKTILKSRKGGT